MMSAGYVIAQLKVTNPENYKEYVAKVSEVVKKYDGEYLVRNGEYQVVEGEDNFPRLVIIRFPSYERALEWYHSDEYKPVKDIRLQNSEGSNIIVKGIILSIVVAGIFSWCVKRYSKENGIYPTCLWISMEKRIVHKWY
jgi:uncharacterized protein (DUF1330 family)